MSANVALSDTFDQWRVKTNELMAMTQTGGMSNFVKLTDTTNSTSNTTGSIITTGGVGVSKSMVVGENLNVHGNIHANGAISADGNLTLGSDDTDAVDFNADIASHLIPNIDSTYNFGNTTFYWANAFINTVDLQQESAAGKPGLKVTGADVDAKLVEIIGAQTTNDILYVNASALTSGSAFVINQDQTDPTTRTLAKVIQNHVGALGTTGLALQMDAGRGVFIDSNLTTSDATYALEIDAEHTTTNTAKIASAVTTGTIIDLQAEAITTGKGINYYDDSLTTGSALYIDSNSADTTGYLGGAGGTAGRSIAQIIQNNASATKSTALYVQNDSSVGLGIDVRGGIGTGGAPAGKIRLSTAETTIVDGDVLGMIQFAAPKETGTDAILIAACIQAEADDTFAADNNATELVFKTAASEAATEKLRITSDGKLGLGIAAPTANFEVNQGTGTGTVILGSASISDPFYLDIKSSRSGADAPLGGLRGYNGANILGEILFSTDDAAGDFDDGLILFKTRPNGGSSTERMRIEEDGKIGIGTAVPSNQVEVASGTGDGITISGFNTAASTTGHLRFNRSLNATVGSHTVPDAEDQLGLIDFCGSDGDSFEQGARIMGIANESWSGTARGAYLSFHTVDDASTTLDERMRIDHNGFVGIGTNAPGNPLRVVQQANATAAISIRSTVSDPTASLHFSTNEGAVDWYVGKNIGGFNAGDIFSIGTTSTGAIKMAITATGNVGFGTTAPASLLDVRGNVTFNDGSDDFDFRVETNANTHALFVDGGADSVGIATTAPLSGSKLDVNGRLALSAELATPSAPAAGKGWLYPKSDGKIYWQSNDIAETDLTGGGAETNAENIWTAQQTFNDQALTSGTSISWNANTAQVATLALAHNGTVATATNQKAGGVYIMRVTQAAAPKTLAWSTGYKWPGNTAPTMTTTASAVDIFTFTSDGTYMYGSFSGSQNYT